MCVCVCVCSQRCDIGDASRGSLSSYAYILMVLYFLQQRQPPVIPVLQEVTLAIQLRAVRDYKLFLWLYAIPEATCYQRCFMCYLIAQTY